MSPWRVVVSFGFVSLAVDMVSDGGRALAGPLLGQLGATALVVGLVTGAGEAIAQALRVITGPWADHTRKYWTFSLVGYAMTALCIPLLAITPGLGVAGLLAATVLILGDRAGKAVRSPAKTVLLASVAQAVGRGRGFAVHKSLDQLGAFLGPLLVAGVVAMTAVIWPGYAVLTIPAAAAMILLAWLRIRVPDPGSYELVDEAYSGSAAATAASAAPERRLPGRFWVFAAAGLAANAGLVTFGVISFHLTDVGIVPLAVVPLLYGAAMAIAALAALASGFLYDRWGAGVLLAVPPLIVLVPMFSLSQNLPGVVIGILAWGAAVGILDSTVKALVADMVPAGRRGTAYGVFAAFEGAGALIAGVLAGALYSHVPVLVAVVIGLQVVSLALLVATLRRRRKEDRGS
ncbi:MAG: MFS transporter [Microbacteriaceae bacterium]